MFIASEHTRPGKVNVLLISSGSVASIKIPLIVEASLEDSRIDVQVVATKTSLTFYTPEEVLKASQGRVRVWTDDDEWGTWNKIGDPILHIELRRWAHLVLVCPCSANMLAKISNGICDNLSTSLLRALDPSTTKTYLFPAMNTLMYTHPLTAKQLRIVKDEIGYEVHGPQAGKALACGDIGPGAMTDWREIVDIAINFVDTKIPRQG
ncbi:hypothetical protein FFLO_03551 [Filobasidium floriforme]|uniref:Flavoprotein domain-containing protein n=1 Tax=Filobasidium floriforme TaxID=5210 RepID=A0A8K0JLY2_9TREE|nr:flavoprotein [Filobasidium floriforme]KAG7535953.1 hypothetical protein FFLO_03551 [Filobasidium floriforme]KAH8086559.1 flavoprotein [Filobasidium floriforme]